MSNNQDFASAACNHLQGITHIQRKCAVNVTRDLAAHIYIESTKWQGVYHNKQ